MGGARRGRRRGHRGQLDRRARRASRPGAPCGGGDRSARRPAAVAGLRRLPSLRRGIHRLHHLPVRLPRRPARLGGTDSGHLGPARPRRRRGSRTVEQADRRLAGSARPVHRAGAAGGGVGHPAGRSGGAGRRRIGHPVRRHVLVRSGRRHRADPLRGPPGRLDQRAGDVHDPVRGRADGRAVPGRRTGRPLRGGGGAGVDGGALRGGGGAGRHAARQPRPAVTDAAMARPPLP